jgi:CHAD domain-containing protein
MAKAKRIKGINCKSVASAGIKLVLLTRFEELYSFHEAALDWNDPEGVHSMRVASRRLRSAIRDFTPYLRKRALAPVLKELKDIADALGEVRDEDVAIMALEKMVSHAPAEFSPALKQFIDAKREVRDRSREELKATLEQTQLKQLEMDFIASVDAATAIRDQSKPQITFQEMSRVVILGRLKELEKLSTGLFQPSEIETLHDMRIAAKRLRYAVELFQQCWRRSIAGYAKRTARIQTALGDVHDCDVWMESVGKEILIARKQKQHHRIAALMWLLSHLIKVRTKHLRTAFARWREWETQEVSDKLRTVLSGGQKA